MAANHSESDYTNVNHGANLLLVLWLTSSVALAFVVVRVFVRVKLLDYHGWDDYSIIISIILGIVGVCLDTVAVRYGLGKHEAYLSTAQITQATKYNFLAIPWNIFSSATAKISVCFFLIHINMNKTAARFLYAASLLLVLFSTATCALLFAQCRPASALWTRKGHCLPPGVNATVGLAQAIFFAVSDLAFATFPLTFLWNLQMNRRTKLALGVVLSLGGLACAFGAVRSVDLQEMSTREDILFSTTNLCIWSVLEQNVTIIASCIPPLYAIFRRTLGNKSSYPTPNHRQSFPSSQGYSNFARSKSSARSQQQADLDGGFDQHTLSNFGNKDESGLLEASVAEVRVGDSTRTEDIGMVDRVGTLPLQRQYPRAAAGNHYERQEPGCEIIRTTEVHISRTAKRLGNY